MSNTTEYNKCKKSNRKRFMQREEKTSENLRTINYSLISHLSTCHLIFPDPSLTVNDFSGFCKLYEIVDSRVPSKINRTSEKLPSNQFLSFINKVFAIYIQS